jgi:hemoglobin
LSSNGQSPYDALGGRLQVLSLVERFYDIMEQTEPELTALHELDGSGKVSRRNRDRFGLFLLGWLGGPDDYVRQNGHPRLRMRHARVPVGIAMRDAWLRCMYAAIDERGVEEPVREFLRQRFHEVADFMRNVEEAP